MCMEIKLKKTRATRVAVVSQVGPYSEAGKIYGEIAKWLEEKRLKITGPPFGWFYDNPEEIEPHRLRSEVGFPFKGEAKPEGNIKIKEIPAQEVFFMSHKGPYSEVGPSYTALFQHAREKGYIPSGCPMEIYLNDPAKVPESELITEIQLPIKKKRTMLCLFFEYAQNSLELNQNIRKQK
jgi:AraC family transcriptional regulator